MTRTTSSKTASLLGAAALCAGTILGTHPVAAGAIKNGSPLELTVGGQINRAIMFVDDGKDTNYRHVDNENDSTRFFLRAEGAINSEWRVGANFEVELRSNPANEVSATVEDTGSVTLEEDTLEVFFSSARFGTLTLGQGVFASDGTAEVDLSGTAVAGYSSVADIAGGFAFVNSATGVRSAVTVADVADNLDGLDEGDRVRYDTPEIKGFTLSVSAGSEGTVDTVLSYGGRIGAVEVAAAVTWYNASGSSTTVEDGFTGSLSALLDNGLNLTLASGTRRAATADRDDATFYYGKVGYKAALNPLGSTNFAVDYGRFEDVGQNGDEFDTFGLQIVQEFEGTGSSVYGAFRNYSLDRAGSKFDDIRAGIVGAFVAF